MEKQSFIRILIIILLSAVTIYFIYSGNVNLNRVIPEIKLENEPNLDSVILNIFEKYGILQKNIQYKKVKFEDFNFVRDEIFVNIPVIIQENKPVVINVDTSILLIHYDLKKELSDYNFKISGVENIQERITTLFIENKGKIIKTLIFKLQIKKERSKEYQLKDKRK